MADSDATHRNLQERFDHVVSIEMLEAVGEACWPGYFRSLRDCLRPGGRAALQAITIADGAFPGYRRGVDFIQRYIFPGGMLPSPSVFAKHTEDAQLVHRTQDFSGHHYDRTLSHWAARVVDAQDEIRKLGFDERFLRMWRYYLAYCQASFRTGRVDLMHAVLQRP